MLQIQEDMKSAMRARKPELLGTIRLLLAAIKQREVDERIILEDDQIISIIDKMIRQRNDSIEQYTKGNRQDLSDIEQAEIVILKKYMPEALPEEEIKKIIDEAILNVQASSLRDMGRVMAIVKAKAQGRADMGKIGTQIKNILENQS